MALAYAVALLFNHIPCGLCGCCVLLSYLAAEMIKVIMAHRV